MAKKDDNPERDDINDEGADADAPPSHADGRRSDPEGGAADGDTDGVDLETPEGDDDASDDDASDDKNATQVESEPTEAEAPLKKSKPNRKKQPKKESSTKASEAPTRAPWTIDRVVDAAKRWVLIQLEPEAYKSVLHVAILLALMAMLRPMFMSIIPDEIYEAESTFVRLLETDLEIIKRAAQRHRPEVPRLLFLAVPTVLFILFKRLPRWTDWEHGKTLRPLIMLPIAMLAWAGSTFDYNHYLNEGHLFDRLFMIGIAIASWYTPLAVPIAVRWSWIMFKEAYVPIPLDDFDFRSVTEVLVCFSIFTWASATKTFKPKHFLIAAMGSWASYYYSAGKAKWSYGPEHSWWLENHLTNLSVGSYVRGWASWFDEQTFLGIIEVARETEVLLSSYTLVLELGALFMFFIHRRTARLWFAGCGILHFGIFVLTGICFWKWMFANAVFVWWLGDRSKPITDGLYRHKLALLLGIASVYYCNYRIWYWPQTRVVWYDSRFTQNYEIWAIGESGKDYLVSPSFIVPMEMHFVQGRLCYATNDRQLTGIYGVTGSYQVLKKLEELEKPEDALPLYNRSRVCRDPKRQRQFDNFMIRYFGNLNKNGRQHEWIDLIGQPTHLWVFPKPRGTGSGRPLYDMQEKVVRIELRRQLMYHHGGKLHNLGEKTVHQVDIPLNGPPNPNGPDQLSTPAPAKPAPKPRPAPKQPTPIRPTPPVRPPPGPVPAPPGSASPPTP